MIFLSEITPVSIRGTVATAGPLAFSAGVFIAVSLGHKSCLGNAELWPALLALNGLVGIVQAILLVFVPESPKYLVSKENDSASARNALRRLRNGTDQEIDRELNMILTSRSPDENGSLL